VSYYSLIVIVLKVRQDFQPAISLKNNGLKARLTRQRALQVHQNLKKSNMENILTFMGVSDRITSGDSNETLENAETESGQFPTSGVIFMI